MALELGQKEEAGAWKSILSSWPELAVDESTGLMVAPDQIYTESHRHFSHQMAYHPLSLIDFSQGEAEQKMIRNTISNLEEVGTSGWVGYSFSWLANMKARSFDGEGAENALEIFATSFCLPNSFHVNGDQSGKGYSNFTYRPFTLEGNFAFAAGLQEMLIQSHTGIVQVFPAVPDSWKNIDFEQLRTVGAFLITAKKESGSVTLVKVKSTVGGIFRLKNPFKNQVFECSADYRMDEKDVMEIQTKPGEEIFLKSKS